MIRIITDSASDISQKKAAEWGIQVLPLKIHFGTEEYLDGVTLSNQEFYEKLFESDVIPKTSQIPPFEYEQVFKKAVEEGNEVLCFCLSSGVSGSFQSASMAAKAYPGQVYVLDTRQFCVSEYIIVHRAVQYRDQGYDAKTIVSLMQKDIQEAHVIAMFNTLEYLKLGGRLSGAAAFAGELLSIKPVLTIEEGVVKIIGKARGSKRGNNLLREAVENLGGIDFDRPVCLGCTGYGDELLRKYVEDSRSLYLGHEDQLQYTSVGATIGTYAGPGAIALAFFAESK